MKREKRSGVRFYLNMQKKWHFNINQKWCALIFAVSLSHEILLWNPILCPKRTIAGKFVRWASPSASCLPMCHMGNNLTRTVDLALFSPLCSHHRVKQYGFTFQFMIFHSCLLNVWNHFKASKKKMISTLFMAFYEPCINTDTLLTSIGHH